MFTSKSPVKTSISVSTQFPPQAGNDAEPEAGIGSRSASPLAGSTQLDPLLQLKSPDRTAVFKAATSDAAVQTGALNDLHNHSLGPGYTQSQIFDMSQTLSQNVLAQIAFFDESGIDKFVWSPIPTNVVESRGHTCCGNDGIPASDGNRTYYLPDEYRSGARMTLDALQRARQVPQYYVNGVDYAVGKAYGELPKEVQERIYPAITGINLGDANSVWHSARLMKEYPGVFVIFGECTKHKEVVSEQNTSYAAGPATDDALHANIRFAGHSGRPFLMHSDTSDVEACVANDQPGQGELWPDVEAALKACPGTTIILAHMGGVGKYTPVGDHHVGKLRQMLADHPNLRIDMSWDVVAAEFSPNPKPSNNASPETVAKFDPRSPTYDEALVQRDIERRHERIEQMAQLITDYPDRFFYGTDALVTRAASSLTSTYGMYANFGQGPGTGRRAGLFDRLAPEVLQQIGRDNFETMMSRARKDALHYDTQVLPGELAAVQATVQRHGKVPNSWPAADEADDRPAKRQRTT